MVSGRTLGRGFNPSASTTKVAKIKYKTVRKLTPAEAGYLAGIIDGEGTVALTRKRRGEQRYAAITISNTDLGMLQWVLKTVGAGNITNKRAANRKWTPSYGYQVYSRQALSTLSQVIPYLRTMKRERAKLLLKNYENLTPRNGKYSEEILRRRARFEQKFFAIKTRA